MMEEIRIYVNNAGELVEMVLNILSLVFVLWGVLMSFLKSVDYRKSQLGVHPQHTYFRKIFGGWLLVSLEFQLAADIVATVIEPTNGHLIQLGAVALIRTFLNYFLTKELKEEDRRPSLPTTDKKTEMHAAI